MKKSTKWIGAGVLAAGGLALGAGAVAATSGADNDQPITGDALAKASAAALDATGGGRVTETEVGDEDSFYEVEVTRDDGSQVDVQLDVDFNVVGSEDDDDSVGATD